MDSETPDLGIYDTEAECIANGAVATIQGNCPFCREDKTPAQPGRHSDEVHHHVRDGAGRGRRMLWTNWPEFYGQDL